MYGHVIYSFTTPLTLSNLLWWLADSISSSVSVPGSQVQPAAAMYYGTLDSSITYTF